MVVSMSGVGNCYDNAPMDSFFATLKTELVHHQRNAFIHEAKTDMFAYIEGYFNRERLHSALGYRSPETYERTARGMTFYVSIIWGEVLLHWNSFLPGSVPEKSTRTQAFLDNTLSANHTRAAASTENGAGCARFRSAEWCSTPKSLDHVILPASPPFDSTFFSCRLLGDTLAEQAAGAAGAPVIELAGDSSIRLAAPGQRVTYQLQVRNDGPEGDTFAVELGSRPGWTAQTSLLAPFYLSADREARFEVAVEIPESAVYPDCASTSLRVTSQSDPARTYGVVLITRLVHPDTPFLPLVQRSASPSPR